MRTIQSFTATVSALSVIVLAMEYLIPAGPVKSTALVAAGLIYLAAVCDQIIGIITRMGV